MSIPNNVLLQVITSTDWTSKDEVAPPRSAGLFSMHRARRVTSAELLSLRANFVTLLDQAITQDHINLAKSVAEAFNGFLIRNERQLRLLLGQDFESFALTIEPE